MLRASGIHTRLNHIIDRAGGVNEYKRRKHLKHIYGLDDDIVNRIWNYGIEEHMSTEILDFIKDISNRQVKEKLDRELLRDYNNTIVMLCAKSDILT